MGGGDCEPEMTSEFRDALSKGRRYTPAEAAEQLPEAQGIYALFVDDHASFPELYATALRSRNSNLIYIGKAGDSLRKRAYEQELRHRNPATFFRSLGAALGFTPPAGSLAGKKNQSNYKFSNEDTQAIITWLDTHVTVAVIEVEKELIPSVEGGLISSLQPLLNIQGNPAALPELVQARARCREIAVGTET